MSVPSKSFRENDELVSDLARFSEGVLTERQVRQRHHLFVNEAWESMGTDDLLVEMVEAEKIRRIMNGAAKRELAQLHLVKAPAVLDSILSDPRANARHRIDSAKALNDLADFTPQVARDVDRVVIHIDMGADVRAKGLPSNPADILEIEAEVRPRDADGKIIDNAPQQRPPMIEDHEEMMPLVKRGPGRPRGSKTKNRKPKLGESELKPRCVPGFDVS